MSQILKDSPFQYPRPGWKLPVGWAFLAVLAALWCGEVAAGEVGDVARSNMASGPQEEISWVSGGIGDEARAEMRRHAVDFNVLLIFSGSRGHYLADVPFTVTRRKGGDVYTGISEGPLLYLKLPPGAYQIAADMNGVWQKRAVVVTSSARITRLSFVSRGE